MVKWIVAFIGFTYAKFPGAILGFLIGSMVDAYFFRGKSQSRTRTYRTTGGGGSPFMGAQSRVSYGDFELNLLSLAAIIIKADGEVSQSELDYVRAFFVQQFGKQRANATFRKFNDVVKSRSVDASRVCAYLRSRTSYEMRLQIIHFLFGIADADGKILTSELNAIIKIAGHLRINNRDFESIKAMFYRSTGASYGAGEVDYKILEIDKNASDTEVKKAYRRMVKKYHPDKLSHMDEAYKKGARQKFNKVQEAYEKIKKERGF